MKLTALITVKFFIQF